MKNAIIASLASIPFAVAGVFSAGAANAAALTGQFSFDGIDDPDTTVLFGANFLDFKPDDGTAQVDLKLKSDSFTGFDSAYIFDLNVDTGGLQSFLDLDALDGLDTLTLTEVSPFSFTHDNFFSTTDVTVDFMGFFESATGEQSNATGRLTFQTLGTITQADLDAGNTYEAAFSGVVVSKVPEPTTMLGLGVVAAASVFGLKKKNS
ncbi:MAG: PEP-CTERM sorting domain-containing protein [Microcoleaceae cyanobacterium]